MGSVKDRIVKRVDMAGLRPSDYRVARRLLDRAHEANGLAVLTYEEAAAVCETESQNTVRGCLARLAEADLLTYRRNARVNIFWHGWRETSEVIQDSANRANPDTNRAVVDHTVEHSENAPKTEVIQDSANCIQSRAPEPEDLTEVIQDSANRANPDTNRAVVDHLASKLSKQASNIHDTKLACLPEGGTGGGQNQPGGRLPPPEDSPTVLAELERCVALLMDPDGLGVDEDSARRWATGCPFDLVRAHVFRLIRERKERPNLEVTVLRTRLQRRWTASVSDTERAHPLWNRYAVGDELWEDPEDSEAARRRMYIPDEYSDIILG